MPNPAADLSASPSPEVMRVLANLTAMILANNNNTMSNDTFGQGYVQDYDDQMNISSSSCVGPTPEQIQLYVSVSWWLEGVTQITLGCFGFVANTLAIPILLSKEMSSIFNRLLTCMAVFDNIFIVCSVLEAVRKHIVTSAFQDYLFGYFLYQFHNMILCCCIYITVVLALERYKAVWHPVEYHHVINAGNPWKRVFYCICPVVIFAVAFNLPKFFEVTFTPVITEWTEFDEDEGVLTVVNVTKMRLTPTRLRLDDKYVLWYSNVARLVITGVIPFASLTYLNSRIYQVILRRRRMTNRPRSAPSAAQKAEEAKQAIVLLVIVVLFLICHTLRIILNIHGLFNLKIVRESLRNGCNLTSHWALIGTSVSHILLTINSSVNFVIYCFLCTTFRGILYRNVNRLMRLCGINKLLPDVQNSEDGGGGGNNNSNGDNRRASAAVAAGAGNNNANNTVIATSADCKSSPKVIVTHKDECSHQNGRANSIISEDKKALILSEKEDKEEKRVAEETNV